MSLNRVVPAAFTPGTKKQFPLQSTVQGTPTQDQYNVTPWQVSGIFTTVVPVSLSNLGTGASQLATVTVPIVSGWPTPVILKQTDFGAVSLSASPIQFTQSNVILGVPSLVLQWASGSALTAANAPSTALVPGTTYVGPKILLQVQAYYAGPIVNPFVVQFTVQAILYGKSQLT